MKKITWNEFKNEVEHKLENEELTGDVRLDHILWSCNKNNPNGCAKPKIAYEEGQKPYLSIS